MITPFRLTATEIEVESDRPLPPSGEVPLEYVSSSLRYGGSTILVHKYRLASVGGQAAFAAATPGLAAASVPAPSAAAASASTQVGTGTTLGTGAQPGTGTITQQGTGVPPGGALPPVPQAPNTGVAVGGGPTPHRPNPPDPHATIHKPSAVPGPPPIKTFMAPPPPPGEQTGPRPDIGVYMWIARRPEGEEKDAHPENAIAEAMVFAADEAGVVEVVVRAAICLGGSEEGARAAWAPDLKPFITRIPGANAPAVLPHPFGRVISRDGKDVTRDVITVYQLSDGNPKETRNPAKAANAAEPKPEPAATSPAAVVAADAEEKASRPSGGSNVKEKASGGKSPK